jgi:hypothetical protein
MHYCRVSDEKVSSVRYSICAGPIRTGMGRTLFVTLDPVAL